MWVTRSSLQSDRRRSLVANKERFFFVFSRSPTRRCSSHHHPLDGRRSPPCSRTDVARRFQRLSSAVALVQKQPSLSPPSNSFSLLRRHATIAHLLLLLVLVFDSRMSTLFGLCDVRVKQKETFSSSKNQSHLSINHASPLLHHSPPSPGRLGLF